MREFDPKQYWNNRLKDKWGLHGVGYRGLGRYYNNWLYKVQSRVFLRSLRSLVADWGGVDVLDIGSGTGFYTDLWQSLKVRSVTPTDIAPFAVEKLQKKFPNSECYQLDIGDNLPAMFRTKRYDIISAFAILYHIVDGDRYQRAFENIYQMLRPGGFFVFSENFIHGDTHSLQHQVSRPLGDIEAMLRRMGFKVKARIPMFVLMAFPVDSRSAIFKMVWNVMMVPVHVFPPLGFILGGLLYPFELLLTSYLKESPSTELMICEKSS